MSEIDQTTDNLTNTYGRIHTAIVSTSKWCAIVMLALITVLMLTEVGFRYFAGSPLGWNVSLIENVLLPAIVFLGMPWGYAVSAHVATDMLFKRLPAKVQSVARWLSFIAVFVGIGALAIAGTSAMLEALKHGDIPPPLSAQLPIYSWIWRSFLPLGSLFTAVVILLESKTFLKGGATGC
ncbi:TRAP transporter small permease [Brevibacterium sp. HMSC24B04]|uniref:TRAP transporter small permease n=1 Tax=Brevibacterium sp. HMSC24B04 TaxID=1581060 RepID=UPI0008A218F6|nr:TRAP transporter small permease [Brevibacterium sp. HMSC24B04]OFT91960.1 hypothetical protein HMPREF3092_08785 [Brevibacterium sp. HMSC24B04]